MEVDEKPTDSYTDIGGLDKQIEELVEAIVLPMQQAEKFKSLGIKAPKGALMYGPPGGFYFDSEVYVWIIADASFALQGRERLSSPVLAPLRPTPATSSSPVLLSSRYVLLSLPSIASPYSLLLLPQMFIGDGAKLVRDCFALAKEKAPAIVFIDEIDAIGTKRFDSDKNGDREVQRTMLELLNQLDGFGSDERIKVGVVLLLVWSRVMEDDVLMMRWTTHRSSPPPTESTSSIPLSFVPDVSTGRSSSLYQQRRLVPRSWSEFQHSKRACSEIADHRAPLAQDPLAQDEGEPQGQLRGVGADDGRVQRSSVEGALEVWD